MEYVTDSNGKWEINGGIRILIEPSDSYLQKQEADRLTQEEHERNNPKPPTVEEQLVEANVTIADLKLRDASIQDDQIFIMEVLIANNLL
jgi:hypothetical protein